MDNNALLSGKTASTFTTRQTLTLVGTVIKSFIGSGVLFLPKAFQNGGWLFSTLAMIFMAAVSTLCILRLVKCREIMAVPAASYGMVGRKAVGRWGQVAVDVSLVLSQAGFGCVYIVFIARNVLQLLNSDKCWLNASWLWLLILAEWPLFTPLVWVRRIASFGSSNLVADALIGAGLTAVLAWSGSGMASLASAGTPLHVQPITSAAPLMLGTAVYAFEGVGMIVPVYDSLPAAGQAVFSRVVLWTVLGVCVVYVTVGLVPYLYVEWAGLAMQDAITLNLPKSGWAAAVVAGYCLALTLSYPLMLFPAVQILEKAAAPYLGLHAATSAEVEQERALTSGMGGKDASLFYDSEGEGEGVPIPGGEDRAALLRRAVKGSVQAAGKEEEGEESSEEKGEDCEVEYMVPRLEGWREMWVRNAFRAFIVAVTLGVAYAGAAQLDNFVSLIGCFCCTPLAFIYPSLFHVRLNKSAGSLSRALDCAVLAFGIGVFGFSTYMAIATWSPTVINPCPYSS